MTTLLTLILIVLVAILICLIVVAVDLHSIRSTAFPKVLSSLTDILRAVRYEPAEEWHHFSTVSGFFVIWEWRGGAWHSDRKTLPKDVDPGVPPRQPGAFEGECIKTWIPGF